MMRRLARTPTASPKSTSRMTVAKKVVTQTQASKVDFEASLGRSKNWRNMDRKDARIMADKTVWEREELLKMSIFKECLLGLSICCDKVSSELDQSTYIWQLFKQRTHEEENDQ